MFPVSRICMEDPKAEDSDEEEPGTLNEFGNVHLDKSFSAPGVKRGLSSTSSVHELLECPICTNSMYPPIYQVFNCFGQHFCLHFEAFVLEMAPVYMAFLRFMGEDDEAKKFCYSLEVGGNGRKLLWQGVPRSIRDGHKKVRNNHDGLIIHRSMALSFSGGNHQELKLRITGRIWKEE